jgi:hypothetical protein
MPLQVKRAGADEFGKYLKVLMAGDQGSGKTRFASTFPDVLYANTEDGLMSVVDREVPHVDIRSAEEMNELRIALNQPSGKREAEFGCPVGTIVIDTLDEFQRILVRERLKETKKDGLVIQDYGWLGDQMRGMVRAFRNLPLNVIFNLHLKNDKDEESGKTYIKPQLVGAMADEIASYMDLVLLLKVTQTTKVIDGRGQRVELRMAQTSADANHTWIKDRSGRLPKPEFEVDLNTDYDRIIKWFGAGNVSPSVNLGVIGGGRSAAPAAVAAPKGPAKVTAAAKKAAGIKEAAPAAAKSAVPAPLLAPEAPAAADEGSDATPASSSGEVVVEQPLSVQAVVEPTSAVVEPVAEPVVVVAEPEVVAESAEPAPEPAVEVAVCSECGVEVDDDQRDFSLIRFRSVLCREHFIAKKAAR